MRFRILMALSVLIAGPAAAWESSCTNGVDDDSAGDDDDTGSAGDDDDSAATPDCGCRTDGTGAGNTLWLAALLVLIGARRSRS